jgi:hypothetical protein
MSSVPKRLQLRRDIAANWVLANPVLLAGEFAYESDTKKVKIGDGILRWNDLGYHASSVPGIAGPTGTTGPSGAASVVTGPTGPAGPVGQALAFDGGDPASSFVSGPVFDCGSVI